MIAEEEGGRDASPSSPPSSPTIGTGEDRVVANTDNDDGGDEARDRAGKDEAVRLPKERGDTLGKQVISESGCPVCDNSTGVRTTHDHHHRATSTVAFKKSEHTIPLHRMVSYLDSRLYEQ